MVATQPKRTRTRTATAIQTERGTRLLCLRLPPTKAFTPGREKPSETDFLADLTYQHHPHYLLFSPPSLPMAAAQLACKSSLQTSSNASDTFSSQAQVLNGIPLSSLLSFISADLSELDCVFLWCNRHLSFCLYSSKNNFPFSLCHMLKLRL